MAFTVKDYHDLVSLLYERPEWRAELRQLILSEEFLNLPKALQNLAEAQDRTEQRIQELSESQNRTEQAVRELSESQDRTEQAVRELGEAQKRTEQRVEELGEAQKRTEQRVEELGEAQKRTEQRVEELGEAQKSTDQRVDKLAQLQAATRSELRNLSERVGATVEEEAEGVLRVVLEQQGYHLVGEPFNLHVNGEVDVVLPLQDAEGKPLWAMIEAKTRLSWRAVEAWTQRMHSPDFQARLQEEGVTGPYLVYVYGMRVDVSARQSAAKLGIGVASSQGEQVAPRGVVEALPQD